MPMLAYFVERAPEGDRRRSARRSLRLGAGSGAAITILDLSLTGALLETSIPMLVGAEFEVELPHAGNVKASILWNSGEFYGCQFDLPIPPSSLSAAFLQARRRTEQNLSRFGSSRRTEGAERRGRAARVEDGRRAEAADTQVTEPIGRSPRRHQGRRWPDPLFGLDIP